jgi:hypothetical protein
MIAQAGISGAQKWRRWDDRAGEALRYGQRPLDPRRDRGHGCAQSQPAHTAQQHLGPPAVRHLAESLAPIRGCRNYGGNLALGMQDQLLRCPKAMPEADRYTLVVSARASRTHARPWSWEICRDGEPLPARLREDGYKTEHTATAAGRFALCDFLAGLAEEESKPDEETRGSPNHFALCRGSAGRDPHPPVPRSHGPKAPSGIRMGAFILPLTASPVRNARLA